MSLTDETLSYTSISGMPLNSTSYGLITSKGPVRRLISMKMFVFGTDPSIPNISICDNKYRIWPRENCLNFLYAHQSSHQNTNQPMGYKQFTEVCDKSCKSLFVFLFREIIWMCLCLRAPCGGLCFSGMDFVPIFEIIQSWLFFCSPNKGKMSLRKMCIHFN